jgi:hypothetical protein
MKKWIKIVLWITGAILTLFFIGLISVYFWLSTKWTDFYTESEMQTMTKEIDLTEPLPDNFYIAYDKIFPNQRNRTLAKMSFQAIWYTLTMNDDRLMNYKQCNCIWTTNFFENKVPINYHSWTSLIIAHGLEKYTSESKCLDYSYHKLGIDSLSIRYYSIPIQELTTKQNIELILRIENPVLYEKRPELLEKEIEKYE